MTLILTIFTVLGLLDMAWWALGARRLRLAGCARGWRAGWHLFMGTQFAGFLLLMGFRGLYLGVNLPESSLAWVYMWSLLVMPGVPAGWLAWAGAGILFFVA